MRENLIIIGAGNVGGFLAYHSEEVLPFKLLGFLDDDPEKQGRVLYGQKVLGFIDNIASYIGSEPLNVIIGIANPKIKRSIAQKLAIFPLQYPNVIMNNVWLSHTTLLGKGVILYPGVSINY